MMDSAHERGTPICQKLDMTIGTPSHSFSLPLTLVSLLSDCDLFSLDLALVL